MTVQDCKGLTLVGIAAMGFGSVAVFAKLAYTAGLNVSSLLAWRFLVASLALCAWLFLSGKTLWAIRSRRHLPLSLLFSAHAAFFLGAVSRLGPSLSALLLYTYPAWVALLQWFVGNEKPARRQWIAIGVSGIGCTLCLQLSVHNFDPFGIALGIVSALCYAVYTVSGARLEGPDDPLWAATWLALIAAVTFGFGACLSGQLILPSSYELFMILFLIGVFATAIPIVASFGALRSLGSTRVAILTAVTPVITLGLEALILRGTLNNPQWLGAGLIVGSIFLLRTGPQS